jgi:putative flippase GtrA
VGSTVMLVETGMAAWMAKLLASTAALPFNYLGRRYLVFPERMAGPWTNTNVSWSVQAKSEDSRDGVRPAR